MLALQLHELVEAQIIRKNINFELLPVQISYELTNLGKSLLPIVLDNERLGIQYIKEVTGITDVDPSCEGKKIRINSENN
ncbi:hypothetical protein ICE98_00366 [Lactococcus lactis]|nr:hypothetical protein [Lactococcus lactis]